jgi:hypothetical protein
MAVNETAEIYAVLNAYYAQKIALNEAIEQLEADARAGIKHEWQIEEHIDSMYRQSWETPEYKEYIEMHKRAYREPEFEKIYRSVFDEIFVNKRRIKPL